MHYDSYPFVKLSLRHFGNIGHRILIETVAGIRHHVNQDCPFWLLILSLHSCLAAHRAHCESCSAPFVYASYLLITTSTVASLRTIGPKRRQPKISEVGSIGAF